MGFLEAFARTASEHPDAPALLYLGERYTFGEIADAARRVAGAFRAAGVSDGDRAMIVLPNCPQWLVCWLALQELGAIAVPISPVYGTADLSLIATNSGARVVVCLDTHFGYVERLLGASPEMLVFVTSLGDMLPAWKRAIGRALDRIQAGRVRSGDRVRRFRPLLGERPIAGTSDIEQSGLAEILYTGGTTGMPKGVPISHPLLLEATRVTREAMEPLIGGGENVAIQGSPLFHVLGQTIGFATLLAGEPLVLLPRVQIDALLDHVQRYRATTFFGVPGLFRMVLEHDRLDQYDLRSLRYCFSGGDVLPEEVERRWHRRVGVHIYQGYGATETCGPITLSPTDQAFREGSCGRVVDFQHVRLVDPETLEEVPAATPGELLVSSEHMVRGYWNAPEETERCYVETAGRRWYRTRDILQRDDEGWLSFVDRTADVIKHKGYRVSASRVEAVLQEHPAVAASCVVGVPDVLYGERIKAFVVLTADAFGVTAHDLLVWARERLAPYEVPQYVEFRDMLPKSKVGKLLRRDLRDEERRLTSGGATRQ